MYTLQQLYHEGISYNVYLSTSKMTCVICSEERHLAKHCKETEQDDHRDNKPVYNNELQSNTIELPSDVFNYLLNRDSNESGVQPSFSQNKQDNQYAATSNKHDVAIGTKFTAMPINVNKRPLMLTMSTASEEERAKPPNKKVSC